MADHRAADLPEGSVVAGDDRAWIKTSYWLDVPWQCTDHFRGSHVGNRVIDEVLADGAEVLRVGTGKEHSADQCRGLDTARTDAPCGGPARFRVVYRSRRGKVLDVEEPWCVPHAIAHCNQATVAGSMAGVGYEPIPQEG